MRLSLFCNDLMICLSCPGSDPCRQWTVGADSQNVHGFIRTAAPHPHQGKWTKTGATHHPHRCQRDQHHGCRPIPRPACTFVPISRLATYQIIILRLITQPTGPISWSRESEALNARPRSHIPTMDLVSSNDKVSTIQRIHKKNLKNWSWTVFTARIICHKPQVAL